jgi:hypothetical protein
LFALPITGCDTPRAAESPDAMDDAVAAQPPVRVTALSPSPCVKIAFLQDQTGSRNSTRTELLTSSDLEIAIDLLRDTCGEILVGAIRDTSNQPFDRLTIGPAPRTPQRPRDDGNVFDVQEAMAAYEKSLATHDREVQQWRDDVNTRVVAFTDRVEALVSETSLARSSAVWDAVFRADVALAEPELARSSEGRRYIVLVSDAQDTTRTRARPLRSGAALIVANGKGTLGSFGPVAGVKAFEGLPPAITWIAELERSNAQ